MMELLYSTQLYINLFNIVLFSSLIYTESIDNYIVYYDEQWKPVPIIQRDNETNVRTPTLRYGYLPCSCQNSSCGCCVNMRLFTNNRTGCMNFIFDPKEFSIGMNMLMDGEKIYENSVSAKNPPAACMDLPTPVMYLPPIQMCIKLYDIYLPDNNKLHMCVNLETKLIRAPLLILQFDCFLMGFDGVSNIKPNNSSNNPTRISLLVINNSDPYFIYNETSADNNSK